MSNEESVRPGQLILVPAVITLAVTLLRLVGELQGWSPRLFSKEAGGGGALVGISWLVVVFGAWFGWKLAKAGQGPGAIGRALGLTILAFALLPVLGFAANKLGMGQQSLSTFAVYVPGQSVYIQGLKQLPANGDVWTFLIDTGSQRGFFGREGAGPTGNEPTAPFIYNDVNDSEVERGIVNVFPGARWKLSLAGGALDLAAFDLEEIGVAPNPFIAANEIMRGRGLQRILFTNLPAVATIRIYTINGNLVRVLEHTDGTGTEEFDVRTRFDLLLASGNYYYHVTTPDGQTKLGRFAVIN